MNGRNVGIALAVVVGSVVLQTTLFSAGRIQPFGIGVNLVLLAVVATVRHLEDEPGLLVGFTGGLLVDLLGGGALGLWAMVLTVIAYVTLRVRDRADDGALVVAVGVFALTFLGQALYALVATLFGQRALAAPGLAGRLLLPGVYNVMLGAALIPGVSWLMQARRRVRGWAT